jgi:hypothetical protein
MLTVTCGVSESGHTDRFPTANFWRWRFACKGWDDIRSIYAPVLSTKEQNALDGRLHLGVNKMLAGLKFLPAETKPKSIEALASYRSLHRYYPSFRHVED